MINCKIFVFFCNSYIESKFRSILEEEFEKNNIFLEELPKLLPYDKLKNRNNLCEFYKNSLSKFQYIFIRDLADFEMLENLLNVENTIKNIFGTLIEYIEFETFEIKYKINNCDSEIRKSFKKHLNNKVDKKLEVYVDNVININDSNRLNEELEKQINLLIKSIAYDIPKTKN